MWLKQLVCICVWSVIYWLLFCAADIYLLYILYIIYLFEQPGDVLSPILKSGIQEVIIMSTYEEFMVLLATASLIVAILNFAHKK